MLETPGRPPGDPQAAHQFQDRHSVLGLGDQIYGQKPGGQRQLAGLEESAHPKGSLMMAGAALIQRLLSTAKYGAVVVSALWAPKTVTPAYLLQRRFTLGFSTILRQEIRQRQASLKLNRIDRHGRTPVVVDGVHSAYTTGSPDAPAELWI